MLDDFSYLTQGDPVAGDAVQIRCEHDGRKFEDTIGPSDHDIDVDAVISLLNQVVDETTEANRRFVSGTVSRSANVGVFFLDRVPRRQVPAYFQAAKASIGE